MAINKLCPVCRNYFKTYPSVNKNTCSASCKQKLRWSDPSYRMAMSIAHKGKSSWNGKKHKRESIIRMRNVKLKNKGPQNRANGYVYIYCPDHPRQINGRVPEQVLIAEMVIGRYLRKGEVVHHINGSKTDNRNDNLLICTDKYHRMIHAKQKGFGTLIQSNPMRDLNTGRFVKVIERKSMAATGR